MGQSKSDGALRKGRPNSARRSTKKSSSTIRPGSRGGAKNSDIETVSGGGEGDCITRKDTFTYDEVAYSTNEIIFTDIGQIYKTYKKSGNAVSNAIKGKSKKTFNYDVVGHVFDYLGSLGSPNPAKFVMIVVLRLDKEVKYCSAAMKSIAFGRATSSAN